MKSTDDKKAKHSEKRKSETEKMLSQKLENIKRIIQIILLYL